MEVDLSRHQDLLEVKAEAGKRWIWDGLRRRWLVLQPEEWIRQLMVHHLLRDLGYNRNRIRLEMGLYVNRQYRRCDILVYDMQMHPFLLVECKAPQIPLSEDVFRQIAQYNMTLQVPYLWVGNGPVNYCCAINYVDRSFTFLDKLPEWPHDAPQTDPKENR